MNVLSPKETKKFNTGHWVGKMTFKKVADLNIGEMDNDEIIPDGLLGGQFMTPKRRKIG